MKKDIKIPQVVDVFMAIVHEYNEVYKCFDWNAYIINQQNNSLEMVMIVSKGFDEQKSTAVMRKTIEKLPAKSYALIEMIPEEVLQLNNEFSVTFFSNNKLFDKTYLFPKNTASETTIEMIPFLNKKGIIVG
ncbi:MAG: hypothetical protein NDI80_02715 [Flavobacteriaceae bacterium]|nr:hypothetical protein [Flavobacteriaceae bacterium]